MNNRRTYLKWCGASATAFFATSNPRISFSKEVDEDQWAKERDAWIEATQGSKTFGAPAVLSKFNDGFYYLRSPMKWTTNKPPTSIIVPEGFVTDLASIPRLFWSLIPRDGSYADAAIIHDFLYWNQNTTRREADQIFLLAMRDLEVARETSHAIYSAVRSYFGEIAWENNRKLKKEGESRVLSSFPNNPAIKWINWKKDPSNLVRTG